MDTTKNDEKEEKDTTKNDEKEEEKDTTKSFMLIVLSIIFLSFLIAAIAWAFQGHFLPTFDDFDA